MFSAGFGSAPAQQSADPFQAEAQRIITEANARLTQLKTFKQSDFVTFSYVLCDNPQQISSVLSQPFNPAVHLDVQKWQAAKAANFDETYPLPIQGFAALETRVQRQVAEVGNFCGLAERAEKEIGNLKLHISDVSLATAKKLKHRHRELRRDLGVVISDLEERALRLGRAAQDPQRQREISDKLDALRMRLETMGVAATSLQSEISSLKKPKPREISDFADLEKQKVTALDRVIGNFKRKNLDKLKQQISRCTASSSSDSIISRFLAISDRNSVALPGRATLVARGGSGAVVPETEAALISLATEKKQFSVANVTQTTQLLETLIGNPRNFPDAKELLEAYRSLATRRVEEISDLRPAVEYLAKKASRGFFGFSDVSSLVPVVEKFPASDGWRLLFLCVRLGAWEAATQISLARPETSEIVAKLRRKFCLSEISDSVRPAAVDLPSFPAESPFRAALASLAQPDVPAVALARIFPEATMEDWLWYGLAHAAAPETESERIDRLAKLRSKLEVSLWSRSSELISHLQRARLLLLVNSTNLMASEAARSEGGLAALLSLVMAKQGFPFESEISSILFPHIEKYSVSDQLKFIGALPPSRLRLDAYKALVLAGTAPLDLLGHWDTASGTFRSGVLQKALVDAEFLRMCGALVGPAVERGDYRKALRLAMLAGDKELFSDLVQRASALVNSATAVVRGALDVHGLKADLDVFMRALA